MRTLHADYQMTPVVGGCLARQHATLGLPRALRSTRNRSLGQNSSCGLPQPGLSVRNPRHAIVSVKVTKQEFRKYRFAPKFL
jgi:hypothetical protein